MATREILILIFFLFYVPLATAFLIVLLTHYLVKDNSEILKKSKQSNSKKSVKHLTLQSVKNTKVLNHKAQAKNDVSDYQKIKTSETVIPVIKATVLEYNAGELGELFNEPTKLYYSPEALQDKEFLESVIRSPWNTKTHELNTSEDNLKVSGWAKESWYDESDKTVYAKGFLIGEDNINYAKENKDTPSFGTSAFISFLKIDKESGLTPEGLEYNAIARKAICNHVAILPNIRDEKNKIVSINAKNALVETSNNKKEIGVKNTMEQIEFNALMEKYNEEKNAKNEETDKIVNAVLERLEEKKNGKNEEPAKEEPKKEPIANEEPAKEEPKKDASNEDHKEPDGDEAKAANALPSEKIVAVFCDAFNTRFVKTPSFIQLAEIAEIETKGKTFTQVLNAVNKKYSELSSNVSSSAKNSETQKTTSIDEVLKGF